MTHDRPKSQLDTLDHVAVCVPNVRSAADWYTKNFHCRVEYLDDTWAFLVFANTKLALVVPSQHPPHVAIRRSDAEKFGRLTQHRDGIRSLYVKDLAGNSLEIVATD